MYGVLIQFWPTRLIVCVKFVTYVGSGCQQHRIQGLPVQGEPLCGGKKN